MITDQTPVPMLRGRPVSDYRCGCGNKATMVKSKEPVCSGCGGIEKSGVKEKKRAGVRQRLFSLGEVTEGIVHIAKNSTRCF